MTLTQVEDTYPLWPWIRKGLEIASAKTNERYRPEDVFLMIMGRVAFVAVFYDPEPIGFIVWQRISDPDGVVLFVFACYGKLAAKQQECYAELVKLAHTIKAKRIRMQGRPGWKRQKFFHAVSTVYEHEVTQV